MPGARDHPALKRFEGGLIQRPPGGHDAPKRSVTLPKWTGYVGPKYAVGNSSFMPVSKAKPRHTCKLAHVAGDRFGLMTQGRGSNQNVMWADRNACQFEFEFEFDANPGSLFRALSIERQPTHGFQERFQCSQPRLHCVFRQTQQAVAQFVYNDGRHPERAGMQCLKPWHHWRIAVKVMIVDANTVPVLAKSADPRQNPRFARQWRAL